MIPMPFFLNNQGDAYIAATGCIPNSPMAAQDDARRIACFALALQSHCDK